MYRPISHVLGLLMLVSSVSDARAQTPVSSRLVLPTEMGRTGVFRIAAGASELQVQATLLDNTGATVRTGSRCPITWTTGDPSILRLVRTSSADAWVKPASEGITQFTASFSCAPSLTASIPVVVGSAGIANPIAPTPQGAAFYPANLKVTPPGWAYVSGGKLFIRPIDTEVQLVASVRSPSDALITPAEFPMKWSVSNPGVLAIDTAYDHTAFVTPVGTGTTTVTFTVEGMSQSFDVTVQDARPATSDDHATLAARTMQIAASSVAGGGTTALPITVRPAPGTGGTTALPITVQPAPGTAGTTALPITVQPAPTSIYTAPAQTAPIIAATPRQPVSTATAGRVGTAVPADTTPPTVMSAPTGPVAATAEPLIVSARNFRAIAGDNYVELLWDPAPGAVGYGLTRADASAPRAMLLTTTGDSVRTALHYIDGNVTPGVTYGYRLRTYFRNSAGALVADPDTSAGALATPKTSTTSAAVQWWRIENNGTNQVKVTFTRNFRIASPTLQLMRARAGYLDQFTKVADLSDNEPLVAQSGFHVDANLPMDQAFAYKIVHVANGSIVDETDMRTVRIAPRPNPVISNCVATTKGAGTSKYYEVKFSVDPLPVFQQFRITVFYASSSTVDLAGGYVGGGFGGAIKTLTVPASVRADVTFDATNVGNYPGYSIQVDGIDDNLGNHPTPLIRQTLRHLRPFDPTPSFGGCSVTP